MVSRSYPPGYAVPREARARGLLDPPAPDDDPQVEFWRKRPRSSNTGREEGSKTGPTKWLPIMTHNGPRCFGGRPSSDRSPEQYDCSEAMPGTVRLNDIVDALEMQFDESSSFLDRDTGQVETVSHVLLSEAEEADDDEEPDLPAWQKQEWEIAKRIVSTDGFQKLPTKFDVTSGRSCRISRARWSPRGFAKIFCTPSTVPEHSGISNRPFAGTASN